MTKIKIHQKNLLIVSTVMLSTSVLPAAEIDYSVGASITRHSNINLESQPAPTEYARSLIGMFTLNEETSNLVANIDTLIEATDYKYDRLEDDVTGRLVGEALWIIKPATFEWYVANTYTQTIIDIFDSATQDNVENANAFETGPNYYVRFSRRNNLAFEARYRNFDYDERTVDNQRYTGAARWLYDVNALTVVGINYEHENIDYSDDPTVIDTKRKDMYATLSYATGNNTLYVDSGKTSYIDDDDKSIEEDRFSVRLESRRSRTSILRIGAEKELTDTGEALIDIISDPLNLEEHIASTSDYYVSKRAYVRYSNELSRSLYDIRVFKSELDYVNQDILNEHNRGVNFSLIYRLSRGHTLTFLGEAIEREYVNVTPIREDKDSTYSVQYSHIAGRRIRLNFALETEIRESNFIDEDYEDDRIMFSIIYTTR
ncbi:MAG: hypothetical protein PVJ63_04100 [Thioalkalispiraceae bacterium]|jgi:hypothetical protein